MTIKKYFESLIDSVTMYRIVLYGLSIIIATALGLSLFSSLGFGIVELLTSLFLILVTAYLSNRLFSRLLNVKYNPESWQITALIIFLLIFPQSDFGGYMQTSAIVVIAMASKYVLVYRGRHIFNPAAIAVALGSLFGILGATWWVGTLYLLPVTVIVGFLIVWKLRHFAMVIAYIAVSVFMAGVMAFLYGFDKGEAIKSLMISSPMIFAATIMLTEPLTSPTTKQNQVIYGVLVGILGGLNLGWISKTEVAITFGNIFSFAIGKRRAIKLQVVELREIAESIYEIVLRPNSSTNFVPGQYIELTLPHKKSDSRGSRRMFSIMSNPDDSLIRIGFVLPTKPSSFKRAMISLKPGDKLTATQTGGDFTLPKNTSRPVVLIAGGIGITPFVSMISNLTSSDDGRQVTLFYGARNRHSLAYAEILNKASLSAGVKVILVLSESTPGWVGEVGNINSLLIKKYVPELDMSQVYISGPHLMVESIKNELIYEGGLGQSQIKTDHFSGY